MILELNSGNPHAGAVRNWIATELLTDSTN
jgi:hypothetical protein